MQLSIPRTDRGRRFRLSQAMEGSIDRLWNLLADVQNWIDWGPLLTGVDYDEATIRENTRGTVTLLKCIPVPFRIIRVEDFFWTWSVFGLTPPADGHRITKTDDGTAIVSFELPLWAAWYLPVCAMALNKIRQLSDNQ